MHSIKNLYYTSVSTSLGNYPELQQAIKRAKELQAALAGAGQTLVEKRLAEAITAASQLRFSIGVVGRAKTGKSTFINAVLGRRDDLYAPVNRSPATNVVTCFANGPEETIRVVRHSDRPEDPGQLIHAVEIRKFACEEGNPRNSKNVKTIEVIAPLPRLGVDVVLVDTPGADNALSNLHDNVLLDFLPRLDAVIFLVRADDPFVESEIRLLSHVQEAHVSKLLFGVTMADAVEADELAEGLEHNRAVLTKLEHGQCNQFVISAKTFQETGSEPGMEDLLEAVQKLVGEGRAAIVTERLIEITKHCAKEAREVVAEDLAMAERSAEEIQAERATIIDLRETLGTKRPALERRFQSAWTRAFEDFRDVLPAIERAMKEEYNALIDRTPDRALTTLAKTVHTDVMKRLDEYLTQPGDGLREAVGEAVRVLGVDFSASLGVAARQIAPVISNKQSFNPAVEAVTSLVPSLLAAFGVASLPGLVASTAMAVAPALVWWNPFTWVAVGAAGAGGAAASALLAPVAALGTPVLIGMACYRCFTTWKGRMAETRNALSLAVKDLITDAIHETTQNVRVLSRKDVLIVDEFLNETTARLTAYEAKLTGLLKERPSAERLEQLKTTLLLLDGVIQPAPTPALPATAADTSAAPAVRLF